MWSGGFHVTPPPFFLLPLQATATLFVQKNTRSPLRLRSPYLHPLVSIHFAALDQLDAEGLLQGPQGHGGGLGSGGEKQGH